MRFNEYLAEGNTHRGDANEILLGYYCLGGSWTGFQGQEEARAVLKDRKKKLTPEEYKNEDGRAIVMTTEVLNWAQANNYKTKVVKVWWVGRPGKLENALDTKLKGSNPADTLLQFADGKFLGLSAKSTQGSRDIGYHNPGLGTVDTELKLTLRKIQDRIERKFIKTHGLSDSQIMRADEIKSSPRIMRAAHDARNNTLRATRNALFKKLDIMPQPKLTKHIIEFWMRKNLGQVPTLVPHIIVTGHGIDGNFTATITDPKKNAKLFAAQTEKIKLVKSGNDTIGVFTDNVKIMRIRAKYGSVPMAAPIEFSVDPWSTKADNQ